MKKQLTKKEEDFCRYYAKLRNSREAAALAGYAVFPAKAGEKLLARQDVKERIVRLSAQMQGVCDAAAGFRRLAFGSVADAVRLIDGERNDLDSLDLFMISDIKLPKGGGMEIKFFDRLKALENLALLEGADKSEGELLLYRALERSAELISGAEEQDED